MKITVEKWEGVPHTPPKGSLWEGNSGRVYMFMFSCGRNKPEYIFMDIAISREFHTYSLNFLTRLRSVTLTDDSP